MRFKNMTLFDAYQLVRSKRSTARPNDGFWKQLIRYEEVGIRAAWSIAEKPSKVIIKSKWIFEYATANFFSFGVLGFLTVK
jgi:hypothetical protein